MITFIGISSEGSCRSRRERPSRIRISDLVGQFDGECRRTPKTISFLATDSFTSKSQAQNQKKRGHHHHRSHHSIYMYCYSLVFEHLDGMIPTHTTIRRTASSQDDLGLSVFGETMKRWADPTLLLVDTGSLFRNKGKRTLHHVGGADTEEYVEGLHFMCQGKDRSVDVVVSLHGAARTSLPRFFFLKCWSRKGDSTLDFMTWREKASGRGTQMAGTVSFSQITART